MRFRNLKKVAAAIGIGTLMLGSINPIYASAQVIINDNTVKIKGVPVIKQFPELPTGCEATALTMLLRAFDVSITKQEAANKIPRVALPYYKNGIRYGGDPNKGFVGNPYSAYSYGVFEKPILQVIDKYLPGRAEDLTGKSFNELLGVLKGGRPVMIWATINMDNVVYKQSWKLATGQNFKWPSKEHAMVLIGYDDTYVYVNDPYTGNEKKYKREVITNRYNTLGKKAVTIAQKKIEEKDNVIEKAELPEIKTDTALKVMINQELMLMETGKEAVLRDDKIFMPIKYMGNLVQGLEYKYIDKDVHLYLDNYNYILAKHKDYISILTNEGTEQKIHYVIEDGVTKLDFRALAEYLKINYVIEEGTLLIDTLNEEAII